MLEFFLVVLGGLIAVLVPLATLRLAIVAVVRVHRLERRLQAHIEETGGRGPAAAEREAAGAVQEEEEEPVPATAATESGSPFEPAAPGPSNVTSQTEQFKWELFIGRHALGWVAVALLILSAAFFLKYAYENNWIGPLGRVAIGCLAGLVLVLGGYVYERRRGPIFSRMLSAAGVVVLYLSFFAAFGFYHLLPQQIAGTFLVILVVESALLAIGYNSLGIALTAIIGGLLTPILMYTPQDRYAELFTYLAALNVGVVAMLLARSWPAVGTLGLLGTQGLFWAWYHGNYHPEKFGWTLGFQAVVFALYLGHTLWVNVIRARRAHWEDLLRLVLNGFFFFVASHALLRQDYEPWMGSLAVAMAVFYALLALWMTSANPRDTRQTLTALAVTGGFVAAAFPIQAEAGWICVGWAAEAALLWWFGQRIAVPSFRGLAAGLATGAVVRLLVVDLPDGVREPFIPIFNSVGLPALCTTLLLIAGLAAAGRFLPRRGRAERILVQTAGAGLVALLWYVLSVECYDYFEAWAHVPEAARQQWLWRGQLALSVLWAVYSLAVLSAGFWFRQSGLRWAAIGLFGATVAKVLLVDMSRLDEIYRILTFFVAAMFLGAAAWAYQRVRLVLEPSQNQTGVDDDGK